MFMATDDAHEVKTLDQLRSMYRAPSQRVIEKKGDRIDGATLTFVANSSFLCLATSDANGHCDVSPRGGPAGQLKVLNDGRTVALPDLGGNNLIDSLTNIVANPYAGLLVMIPGSDETLRIDGPARLTTDPDVISLWDDELRTPKLAVVIDVDSVFLHCAKAFRRGSVWLPETWPELSDTAACEMFNDIVGDEVMPAAEMRTLLEADYASSLAEERAG
jgi:PPOX class probable FMN-dependent enzyme